MSVTLSSYALCSEAYVKRQIQPEPSAAKDDLIRQLINAATDMVERYCGGRNFKSRTHYEWLSGSGDRSLVLPHWPVVSVARVSIGEIEALSVMNEDDDATQAYVSFDGTNVTLTIADGTNAGTDDLAVGTYTTLGDLRDAIVAVGKSWTATVQGAYSGYQTAKLRKCGNKAAYDQYAYLVMPDEPEDAWKVNLESENEGIIMLKHGVFPVGTDNVYVEYAAGYATIPVGLQQICAEAVQAMYYAGQRDGGLRSESLGDYSWAAADSAGGILNEAIRARLAPFRDYMN